MYSGPALLAAVALLAAASGAAGAEPRGEVKTRLAAAERHLDAWDIPAARAELAEIEKIAPEGMEPLLYFQGRVAFEEGRYEEADRLMTRAGAQDKEGSYLRLARQSQKVTKGHESTQSAHFIFSYPPGKDALLAPWALEGLEAIREALHADLGWVPPEKVRVEVVNNANELAQVSTLTYEQIRTTGTIAICKFNKLMVTSPKAVLRGYDWLDTLAHEYVHLVVTQKSRNTVPIWLHEGLAKYLESRWRGAAGLTLSPSARALLGRRVRADDLVPFEKMHPSMAMLPTAEDAATAFAEVYFAVDLLYQRHGAAGLRAVIEALAAGKSDKKAVEAAAGQPFAAFEKSWLAHVKSQPYPKELLPPEHVVLKDQTPTKAKLDELAKGREISFGDFDEVQEVEARKSAHLGELFRERNRPKAAADEFGKAYQVVGDRYEAISNKYALALLELLRTEEAEKVLLGSLRVYPSSPATNVHLGRIYMARRELEKARRAYLKALAADPFDEEIHFALLRISLGLGDRELEARVRKAVVVLTGLSGKDAEQVAQRMVKEGQALSEVDLASPAKGAGARDAGAGAADGGMR